MTVLQLHEILQALLPRIWTAVTPFVSLPGHRNQDLYNKLKANGNDVFITLCCDGVPWAASSGVSFYPILGYVNGLSASRTKESIFICGVWITGKIDGKMAVRPYFLPLVQQLHHLGMHFRN